MSSAEPMSDEALAQERGALRRELEALKRDAA
jgi:hypothetical protein